MCLFLDWLYWALVGVGGSDFIGHYSGRKGCPRRRTGCSPRRRTGLPDTYPMHTRCIPRRIPRCSDHAYVAGILAHAHVGHLELPVFVLFVHIMPFPVECNFSGCMQRGNLSILHVSVETNSLAYHSCHLVGSIPSEKKSFSSWTGADGSSAQDGRRSRCKTSNNKT